MKIRLRTHILPVGRDEPKRLLKPLMHLKPDRIYMLTVKGKDAFKEEYDQIKQTIINEGIVDKKNLKEYKSNYYNLLDFMKTIAEIVQIEKKENNEIYFNISGGTMISVVGTLSALFFGVVPYFAKKDYNKDKILDDAIIPEIPEYPLDKPDRNLVVLLNLMNNFLDNKKRQSISKGECLDLILKSGLISGFNGKTPSDYNKLKNRYLDRMLKRNYIYMDKRIHSKINITKEGKFAVNVLSAIMDISI